MRVDASRSSTCGDGLSIDVMRVRLLRELGQHLSRLELSDINLLLPESGLEAVDPVYWYGNDHWEPSQDQRSIEVLQRLRLLSSQELLDLGAAVGALFGQDRLVTLPSDEPVVIFASHLSAQRALVGQVRDALTSWGVQLFVAHDSIEPDMEWQLEIERALSSCHAGVAFLFPGFQSSLWCDQEVGWILGRAIPCLALRFQGQDPYGPLGRKQALAIPDSHTAVQIASAILDWLETKSSIRPHLNSSLVEALKRSKSFNQTDHVWARIAKASDLQAAQVAGLLTAIRDNDQVYNANGGFGHEPRPYKELVLELALKQPGIEGNFDLAREVAKARDIEAALGEVGHVIPNDEGDGDEPPF